MEKMTSSQPYLVRAMYEWIADNDMTPLLVVDATGDAVKVPMKAVSDGQITLNLSPSATQRLQMDNESVSCNMRFSGKEFAIFFPTKAVLAVYARETGDGMVFQITDGDPESTQAEQEEPATLVEAGIKPIPPHLSIVR